MNILGISDVTGNHSHSSIALLQDGQLTFALSQERISRVKNDPRFPYDAIQAALDFVGLRLDEIDAFACGYPPANYYGSLMHRSKMDLLRSLLGVMTHRPLRLARYLFPNIRKGLFDPKGKNGLLSMGVDKENFYFIDHHLAHVSAAYHFSDFDECLGISYGGFAPHSSGQNVAGAVYRCRENEIEFLEDIPMFATGCYYSGISVALGFKYMEQEGKTMGMAALGDASACYDDVKRVSTQFADGQWHPYSHWIDYVMSPRKDVFLGSKSGRRLSKILDRHLPQDLAAAAQQVWQENITNFIKYLIEKYSIDNFVLAGGNFLNARIVQHIAELPEVKEVFVHPHTGDGSTTIGAAIEVHRMLVQEPVRLPIRDMGLGMEFDDIAIEHDLRRWGSSVKFSKIDTDISLYVAQQLAAGKIIGWFQGREEYGPRSLGHRCILADPRFVGLRDKITTMIKKRESFIPISPSCLAEYCLEYFEKFTPTPYMTRTFTVRPHQRKNIPAALHRDGTARVQAVDETCYLPFRKIIEHFYSITGVPMVLNTSLNRHGEPIVHRPLEAVKLLQETPLDELVIGSFSVKKA